MYDSINVTNEKISQISFIVMIFKQLYFDQYGVQERRNIWFQQDILALLIGN